MLREGNEISQPTKPAHQNQYTGTSQSVVALPLNAEHRPRKIQLPRASGVFSVILYFLMTEKLMHEEFFFGNLNFNFLK